MNPLKVSWREVENVKPTHRFLFYLASEHLGGLYTIFVNEYFNALKTVERNFFSGKSGGSFN